MEDNLAIDDDLLALAWQLAGLKTKEETVNQALKEFVQHRQQKALIDLFGTIEYDQDYDHAHLRNRRADRQHQ